jgi:hypothetical protein
MTGSAVRRGPIGLVLAAAVSLAVVAGCNGDGPAPSSSATDASGLASGGAVGSADVSRPSDGPIAFNAITIKGRGDKVAKFKIPEDVVAIAMFTHSGSSNFAITTVDANGGQGDLLVNVIGKYKGTVLFDEDSHSRAFKINADGAWTVVIKPIGSARRWDLSATLTGTGDDVIRVTGTVSGLASSVVKHSGKRNFAVVTFTDDGRDLIINEIGRYSGEILMPTGLIAIVISADGKWSFTVPN